MPKARNQVKRSVEMPLILGGHSFISQLGNDQPASEEEQRSIVQSCLEHGIRWFDTTYRPERVALGKVLDELPAGKRYLCAALLQPTVDLLIRVWTPIRLKKSLRKQNGREG